MIYRHFIEQVKELITAGNALVGRAFPDTREFRDWRLRAENVVENIRDEGYELPAAFKSKERKYGQRYGPTEPLRKREIFDEALGDSLGELSFLVDQFERHGPPRKRSGPPALMDVPRPGSAIPDLPSPTLEVPVTPVSKAAATETPALPIPLAKPEHLTFRWMFDNVSLPGWATIIGILLGAFAAGFIVAQIPGSRALLCSVKSDLCPAATSATAVKPAEAAPNSGQSTTIPGNGNSTGISENQSGGTTAGTINDGNGHREEKTAPTPHN
jgi:hypothetical protein